VPATTAAPDSTAPSSSSDPPIGAGDTGLSPLGGGPGQEIPFDAQALLSSLHRTAPNDDKVLVEGEQALLAAGYEPDAAARIAYGRFPVAGPASWSDDWLAPRFTGTTFRFHLGVDLIAAYGTPLRSPADGTIDVYDDAVGGLAVMIKDVDGTVYELAHMSALAPGIARGGTVRVGDPLGAIGQTGDATGPHCHFGVWLHGTKPTSPKPVVDQWVIDAAAQINAVLHPVMASSTRALLGTALVRDAMESVTPAGAALPARTDLLFATSANPTGGALRLAEATAAQLRTGFDWSAQSREDARTRQAWQQAMARAWRVVGPLASGPVRHALPTFSTS
jgi:murein DD-endopeptidase MepM/ murein hydrolase activator NlpD